MNDIPLIRPNPPRLSRLVAELEAIEASGTFSNGGPVARRFEAAAVDALFGGRGGCLAVCNATIGLMIALRYMTRDHAPGGLALVPAFTFAATGQAAAWAGLTPLLGDIDRDDWCLDPAAAERLLRVHKGRIAAIVPYAAFGVAIDLERWTWLARRHGAALVVDAAASLGSLDAEGQGFGGGSRAALVYSMHATKTFATGEGGLVYSADEGLMAGLRAMTNFGFEAGRSATLPGLNAKLSEVGALLALAKLGEIEAVADHRAALAARYRAGLDGFVLQRERGRRQAMQFMPVLLPAGLAPDRERVIARLGAQGIGAGCYFSPHLGEQPWFRDHAEAGPLPVSADVAARVVALPITDAMTLDEVGIVCAAFAAAAAVGGAEDARPRLALRARPPIQGCVLVGGGPAGTAMLLAAARNGLLDPLAAEGLTVIERGPALGCGRLGGYAITSDSTAETFLTSVRDAREPELAAVAASPEAEAIAAHIGGLGVPLATVGAFIDRLGRALGDLVEGAGGAVLTGHEFLSARRGADGLWRCRVRRLADRREQEIVTRTIVSATGGHQPLDRLVGARVAGQPLVARWGGKLLQSDAVLAQDGLAHVRALLARVAHPRVAIVGGSTSAITSAVRLLDAQPALGLGEGALTVLHRAPMRPFFPSIAAAHAAGYTDFAPDDVCPLSGFVHRLGGFRLEARALVCRMIGIEGTPDPRLRLHRLAPGDDATAVALLDAADVIVAALGYAPRALPLLDIGGDAIALPADTPLVDARCRILAATGRPVPGVFAIGLAAGFRPSGALGGEPSFRGQANGLWLWQNDVGAMIAGEVLEFGGHERAAARASA